MREGRAVLKMPLVEPRCAAASVSSERDVFLGVQTLIARSVKPPTRTACLVIVKPRRVILKVQDQP
jgi:hypothetical protein